MQDTEDSLPLGPFSVVARPGLLPILRFEVHSSATVSDNHGVENFVLDIEEGVAARDFS